MALALQIHGQPNNKLKEIRILKTWNTIGKVVGPICKFIINVPNTSLLVLLYALTI